MKELASQVVALFSQYGYGAVFVGVMLDNAGIPLAEELTLLWSGTMVTVGMLVADQLHQVFAQMESARSALLTLAGLAFLIYAGMKIRTRLRHGKAQYVPPSAAPGKEA